MPLATHGSGGDLEPGRLDGSDLTSQQGARESIDPKLAVLARARDEKVSSLDRSHTQSAREKPQVQLTDRDSDDDQDGSSRSPSSSPSSGHDRGVGSWDMAEKKSTQAKPSEKEAKAVLRKIDAFMMPIMSAVYLLTFLDKVRPSMLLLYKLCQGKSRRSR